MIQQHTSAPPKTGDVVELGKQIHDRLGEVLFALPGRSTVTYEELGDLGARLRGLAKIFDRYAPTRPMAERPGSATAPQENARVWVFPGQQR
ncbi:hypothetical protein INP57_26800 [Saccharopolyspora sp. HNM0986]|uniref:hypothetical protein n=1 Tax=Saccharopolyspora galaxeae TaxID=2781241 RepID=UPI00190BD95F|nr:hypothetical protein [Saccharopolyspora sp. HNM0986]MBK0870418.1 hypothetical protein [Saccharopolyspora sp. HNM0986]